MNVLTTSKITEHVLAEHLVLLDHTSNQLLLFNPSARQVWQWFTRGYSDKQVIDKLAIFFNIPRSNAEQDVKTLCDNWHRHKLLANSIENEIPLEAEKDISSVVCTNFDTKSLNTRKNYLLANTPFSLHFNDQNILANNIHSLFAHIEVYDQQPLKNFTLIEANNKHILLADGEELFCEASELDIKGYLINEILQLSYPNTEWLTILHAMAVANGEKVVVMPAPSGHGKSTLTAALLKEGFSYLGDDMVPIQRGTHNITPLLTSLSIKKGSWPILDNHYPELEELPIYNSRERHVRYLNPSRYMQTRAHLPVTALVFPRYQAGQSATLKPISTVEALQRLIENDVWLGNPLENNIVTEFLAWLGDMPCFSFYYSELDEAVQKIQELLSEN